MLFPVLFFLALSLIILLSPLTALFQRPFPEALAAGSSTVLFWSHQSILTLYRPSGHLGKKGSPHSLPCSIGGMRAKNESGVLQSKTKNVYRAMLTNLATHLKNRIDNGVGGLLDIYESVLAELATLDQVAAEGAWVRSRAQ